MGKSTISSGPFSIANCNTLPEGILGLLWIPSNLQGIVGRSSIIIHHYMGNPVEAMNQKRFFILAIPKHKGGLPLLKNSFPLMRFLMPFCSWWLRKCGQKSETFWGEHPISSSLNGRPTQSILVTDRHVKATNGLEVNFHPRKKPSIDKKGPPVENSFSWDMAVAEFYGLW